MWPWRPRLVQGRGEVRVKRMSHTRGCGWLSLVDCNLTTINDLYITDIAQCVINPYSSRMSPIAFSTNSILGPNIKLKLKLLSQPNNNHNPNNKTTITVVGLRQSNHWEPPPPPPPPTTHHHQELKTRW